MRVPGQAILTGLPPRRSTGHLRGVAVIGLLIAASALSGCSAGKPAYQSDHSEPSTAIGPMQNGLSSGPTSTSSRLNGSSPTTPTTKPGATGLGSKPSHPASSTTGQPATGGTTTTNEPSGASGTPSTTTTHTTTTTGPPFGTGYIYELSSGKPDEQTCPPEVIGGYWVQACRATTAGGSESIVEVYSGTVSASTSVDAPGGTATFSPGAPGVNPSWTLTFDCAPPGDCGAGSGLSGGFGTPGTTEDVSVVWNSPGGAIHQAGTNNDVQPDYDVNHVSWSAPIPADIDVGMAAAPVPVA